MNNTERDFNKIIYDMTLNALSGVTYQEIRIDDQGYQVCIMVAPLSEDE